MRQPLAQHDEFLAAIAVDAVVGARRRVQFARDLAQRLVADRMAVTVVDGLEMVDVDDQQAHRPDRIRLAQRPRTLAVEAAAVEQPGQRIVSALAQQRLVALAIGQRLEDIRHAAPGQAPAFAEAQIEPGEHRIDGGRAHLGGPAAVEHLQSARRHRSAAP